MRDTAILNLCIMHVTNNDEDKQDLHSYRYLDNTRVSQMAFIPWQSLDQLPQEILKMLQNLAVAEIQW